MSSIPLETDSVSGLTEAEAQRLAAAGKSNISQQQTSRSYADILRYNILNPVNIVLYLIGVVLVAMGRPDDAFVTIAVVVVNVGLGTFQETRAKRKLDEIALLTRPRVIVVRDGKEREVTPDAVVLGDVLVLAPGDQFVVDGELLTDAPVEVDESPLTGESDAIIKTQGDTLLSGSYCLAGGGRYRATQVGADSFINKLTVKARQFRVTQTPLQQNVNFVVRLLTTLAAIIGFILFLSAVIHDIPGVRTAQIAAIIAGFIPSGLFALVIISYATGSLRMAQYGALVQQTNAVESMSHVNVLCTDKTGTLTTNRIRYHASHPFTTSKEQLETALGHFVRSASTTNKTSDAIIDALPGEKQPITDEVVFSSSRKWSALAFDTGDMRGAYVMGAAEMLRPALSDPDAITTQIKPLSDKGLRVLLFAHAPDALTLHDADQAPALPAQLTPLGLITFEDELREGVQDTIRSLYDAGIDVKVISGDSPDTVAALAALAGFKGDLRSVSGTELDALSDAEIDAVSTSTTVFGRITPEQKERLVDSLRRQGGYVAMMGDGVNDVLPLKKADVGIAMYSGTTAARSVADMVLLNDSFNVVPKALTEGQRIVNGLATTFRLFQARSFFVVFMILAIGIMGIGFPYLPKHNALGSTLGATVPTFLLMLIAQGGPQRQPFLPSVYRFVFPAALVSTFFGIFLYTGMFVLVQQNMIQIPFTQESVAMYQSYAGIDYAIDTPGAFSVELATFFAQTALTIFNLITAALLVLFAAPPHRFFTTGNEVVGDQRVWGIAALVLAIVAVIFIVPPFTTFFELVPLTASAYGIIAAVTVLWVFVLRWAWRQQILMRFLGVDEHFRITAQVPGTQTTND